MIFVRIILKDTEIFKGFEKRHIFTFAMKMRYANKILQCDREFCNIIVNIFGCHWKFLQNYFDIW